MSITIDQVQSSREKAAALAMKVDEAEASLEELTAGAFGGSLDDVTEEEWARLYKLSDAFAAARRSARLEEIVLESILEAWFDEIELRLLGLMAADAEQFDGQKSHYKKPAQMIGEYAKSLGVNAWLSEHSGSLVIEEPKGLGERRVPVCVTALECGKYVIRFSAERIRKMHGAALGKTALPESEIRELAVSMLDEIDAVNAEKNRFREKISEVKDKYRRVFGCSIREIEDL